MNSRVKIIRKEANKTQESFADSIGISRSNLTNIETGKVSVTDRTKKSICAIYGIDEHWFETGEGTMYIEDKDIDFDFDKLVGELYAEKDMFKKKLIKTVLEMDSQEVEVLKNFIFKIKG